MFGHFTTLCMKGLKGYKHFELINDKYSAEKKVVLRKSGTIRKYICGQLMVYTKPIRKMFQSFTEKGREMLVIVNILKI